MNNLSRISLREILERPVVELYTDLFGEENWNAISDEYASIHKVVGKFRNRREKLNGQTKKSINLRNEKNNEVKSINSKVDSLKQMRDMENKTVKRLKQERSALEKIIKNQKKGTIESEKDEPSDKQLEKAVESHENKHKEILLAASDAQSTHEEIIRLNQLRGELRAIAQTHHTSLRQSKKEADLCHQLFIRFLDHSKKLKQLMKEEEE